MATLKTRIRPTEKQTLWTDEVTIDGAIDDIVLIDISELPVAWGANNNTEKGVITNIYVQYITASDTNETQNIRIGNTGNISAHASNINTTAGMSAGDVEVFPQSVFDAVPRLLSTDGWLSVHFRNSSGAGVVKVGVEVSYDMTDWVGFTPQSPN